MNKAGDIGIDNLCATVRTDLPEVLAEFPLLLEEMRRMAGSLEHLAFSYTDLALEKRQRDHHGTERHPPVPQAGFF